MYECGGKIGLYCVWLMGGEGKRRGFMTTGTWW